MSRLLSVILLLVACHATYGEVASQVENKYRLPNDVTVNSYELTMDPDLNPEKFAFTGVVKISVTVMEKVDTDTLTLNAKNLEVKEEDVTVETSKGSKLVMNDVKYDPEYEFLLIKLKDKLVSGTNYTLTIKFSGVLNDQKTGFYRSRFFDKDNKVQYIAATHFEATGARWAFPCWDEPAYKAPFTITIKHQEKYKVFSNMPLNGKPTKDGDKLVSTFEKTPPISTYLVAFVVAEYDCVETEDHFFRVCTKPQAKDQGKYALEKGKQVLDQLNKYTELNYTKNMKKMDQVTIRDFAPSAMENWGLVTYRETSLLVDEGHTTTSTKQTITTVIAHEFAHQWFGNLVSPKWWSYVWLNEGFANYMQYFITNQIIPEWRLNETFVVESMQGNAFVVDAVQNARPMDKEAQSPSQISTLFDSIGYQKAGSVIRMISHVMGEEAFHNGLKNYLAKHQLKAANSDDLLQALQEKTDKPELVKRMKTWITNPGYPVVNVKKVKDGEFEISQERFLIDGSSDTTKWWVPLTYTHQSKMDFTNTAPAAWLNASDASLTISENINDDWILFNIMQTGYYRVNYFPENWASLDKYLKTDDFVKIPPVNRAQLVDDALNLARARHLNYSDALALTIYLHKEADYIPWSAAFKNINFLNSMLRSSKNYHIFKKYIEYITKKLVEDVGFEPKADEEDIHKVLRVTLMKWACKAGVKECNEYANNQFKKWLNDSSASLDVDLKRTILCAGVRNADSGKWNTTVQLLSDSTKDEDEKKSLLLSIPICSNSEDVLKSYLLATLTKDYPVSFNAVVQGIVTEHPNGVNIALSVLREKFNEISKLDNGNDIIVLSVLAIANSVSNEEELLEVSRFISDTGSNEKNVHNMDKAYKNLGWSRSFEEEVNKWLVANEGLFNSAASLGFTSLLVVLSIFITRFF